MGRQLKILTFEDYGKALEMIEQNTLKLKQAREEFEIKTTSLELEHDEIWAEINTYKERGGPVGCCNECGKLFDAKGNLVNENAAKANVFSERRVKWPS